MKGGEKLHFRYFLISGLMVGAALFLPNNAFAAKNDVDGQQSSQKEIVQTISSTKTDNGLTKANVPTKAENAKPQVTAEPAGKNKVVRNQQVSKQPPQQAASQKRAVTPKNLPEQANGHGQSAIQTAKKNVEAPGQQKKAPLQGNIHGLGKITLTTKNRPSPSYNEVSEKSESSINLNTSREGSRLTVQKKAEPPVHMPARKGKIPASKEEIPNVDRSSNPTQRSNNSGGSSNDRVSQGLSTLSQLEKWFEWNKYYEIKFVQLYLSRSALLTNQWMNAPPAPPPQNAPLLKMVNRS